jgi:hypothetical protein
MTVSLHTSPHISPPPFVPDTTTELAPSPIVTAAPPNDPPAASTVPQQFQALTYRAPTFREALGYRHDLKTFGDSLMEIAKRLGPDATPQAVLAALKATSMASHPDSPFRSEGSGNTTLESFIHRKGFSVPSNHFALTSLADAVIDKSQEHPLGGLGGALDWPVPLSNDDQRHLRALAMRYAEPKGEQPMVMQTKGLLLEFLRHKTPLPADALKDPVATLNALIDSPEGREMGKALQQQMQGIATDSSTTDYLLAAMTLQLDQESIMSFRRNSLAGFELDNKNYTGKPASTVVDGLSKHLVEQRKTSPELANAAAYLLLASRAPVFLIKDLPPSVTYGSPAWVNLAIAAATIEAHTPGKVPSMTFAEVMLEAKNAADQDPAVTAKAQREALIDWGVANGVIEPKFETAYSAADLDHLVKTFNNRRGLMEKAAQALDEDIPSRKEMALAELRKRFPNLEALFEEKLIHVTRKQGANYRTEEVGPHSMLDIAMMDLPGPDLVYSSKDKRVPLKALNANSQFGVAAPFEAQFKRVIEEKKQGINTYIKHLISQLPIEDRKNFEFGKVSLYQNHSHTIGMGFFDRTDHPKGNELMVRTERNGVPTAYEIDFNAGSIRTVPEWKAEPSSRRVANYVKEIKVFTPAEGESDLASEKTPQSHSLHDSFGSNRTQLIADAFVEHVNLDDDAIKQAARGLTTADKNHNRAAAVTDFLLDLIPFRSAINNFRKGNIGAGMLDLGLDLFGFLTAGAGAAGKVVKIAGTTASAASKVARAAKTIGVATFGALNPLAGLGDFAVGSAQRTSAGLQRLIAKSVQGVNVLRGASGSYDLLKAASKTYDFAAVGTYKVAGQTIAGGAVFHDSKWYRYDPASQRAYGSALSDFKPDVTAHEGEVKLFLDTWIGKKITSILAPTAPNPNFRQDYRQAINRANAEDHLAYIRGKETGDPTQIFGYSSALKIDELKLLAVAERRTPAELGSLANRIDELELLPDRLSAGRQTAQIVDLHAFKKGYAAGTPEGISGFSDTLTLNQLAELAVARGRTPEEFGHLVKYMEKRRILISLENFRSFNDDITAAKGKAVAVSQGFYLSQVSLLSDGECAALSNVMAAAFKQGKQDIFIENLYSAILPVLSPDEIAALNRLDPVKAANEQRRATKVAKFQARLNSIQGILGHNFHLGMQARQVPYTTIISELSNANSSKTLLINGPGHGIIAGVIVSNGKKEWFYFDPNFGKATFSTQAVMSAALENTLKAGKSKNLLPHFGNNPNAPEYKISVFNETELNITTQGIPGGVSDLFQIKL